MRVKRCVGILVLCVLATFVRGSRNSRTKVNATKAPTFAGFMESLGLAGGRQDSASRDVAFRQNQPAFAPMPGTFAAAGHGPRPLGPRALPPTQPVRPPGDAASFSPGPGRAQPAGPWGERVDPLAPLSPVAPSAAAPVNFAYRGRRYWPQPASAGPAESETVHRVSPVQYTSVIDYAAGGTSMENAEAVRINLHTNGNLVFLRQGEEKTVLASFHVASELEGVVRLPRKDMFTLKRKYALPADKVITLRASSEYIASRWVDVLTTELKKTAKLPADEMLQKAEAMLRTFESEFVQLNNRNADTSRQAEAVRKTFELRVADLEKAVVEAKMSACSLPRGVQVGSDEVSTVAKENEEGEAPAPSGGKGKGKGKGKPPPPPAKGKGTAPVAPAEQSSGSGESSGDANEGSGPSAPGGKGAKGKFPGKGNLPPPPAGKADGGGKGKKGGKPPPPGGANPPPAAAAGKGKKGGSPGVGDVIIVSQQEFLATVPIKMLQQNSLNTIPVKSLMDAELTSAGSASEAASSGDEADADSYLKPAAPVKKTKYVLSGIDANVEGVLVSQSNKIKNVLKPKGLSLDAYMESLVKKDTAAIRMLLDDTAFFDAWMLLVKPISSDLLETAEGDVYLQKPELLPQDKYSGINPSSELVYKFVGKHALISSILGCVSLHSISESTQTTISQSARERSAFFKGQSASSLVETIDEAISNFLVTVFTGVPTDRKRVTEYTKFERYIVERAQATVQSGGESKKVVVPLLYVANVLNDNDKFMRLRSALVASNASMKSSPLPVDLFLQFTQDNPAPKSGRPSYLSNIKTSCQTIDAFDTLGETEGAGEILYELDSRIKKMESCKAVLPSFSDVFNKDLTPAKVVASELEAVVKDGVNAAGVIAQKFERPTQSLFEQAMAVAVLKPKKPAGERMKDNEMLDDGNLRNLLIAFCKQVKSHIHDVGTFRTRV